MGLATKPREPVWGDDLVYIYRLSFGSLRTDIFIQHTRYAMHSERQEHALLPHNDGNISPQTGTEWLYTLVSGRFSPTRHELTVVVISSRFVPAPTLDLDT